MNAQEIIESYVTDVALHLPVKQRGDVAAELRSLLEEELGLGDANAALALVRRFGRPADVAARYHPSSAVIDPSDTRAFVIAAIFGALLTPNTNRHLPLSVSPETALLFFLSWLGMLVLLFAAKSWAQRRWPQYFQWKPSKVRDRDRAYPVAQFALVLGFAALLAVYVWPTAILPALTGMPADRFAYTADFVQPLRAWGFIFLVAVLIALHAYAGFAGRWTRLAHVLAICFLISAGVQLGWHASYGRIFADASIDAIGRVVFEIVSGLMLLVAIWEIYREWARVPATNGLLSTP